MKTKWELEEEEKRDRERRIISVLLIIAFMIVAIISMIMATTTVSEGVSPDDAYALEQAQEPMIRAVSHKAQIDPVYTAYMERLKEQAENPEVPEWDWSDTPQLDMDDDNFEMLVECAFAEAGNQTEYGKRLVVDVIGNRAGWDMAEVDDVITAKNQFTSYPNGMAKHRANITEDFIQLVADEWARSDKACGSVNVWYFRTLHYSEYGSHWKQEDDHFFSKK